MVNESPYLFVSSHLSPRFSILEMVFSGQVSIDAGNQAMQPLRGFVLALSMGMPSAQGKDDFKVLGLIANPGSNNPVEVMDALKIVNDSKPASRGMLAGFRMIPSGKKLLTLVEEFVAGRADSMKLLSGVHEAKSKAVTFQEVVKSLKPEEGVSHCLDLLASLRPAVGKKPGDDLLTAALKQASEEVIKLGGALVEGHVGGEAFTWLCSQAETLQTSYIMSQPPAFEVLKLPAEFKAVLQHEMQSLTDLGKFYKSLEALATQVTALRQEQGDLGPDEMAEKRRSGIVALCQASQTFQDIKRGTFVSCPGLYMPTKKFNDALNMYLHGQCVSSWKHSLTRPLVVVSKIIGWAWEDQPFQEEDKTVLATALDRVADAKLLATGFQDGRVKADVHLATHFVEALVHLAESVLDGSRSQAVSVRALHGILIALELVAKDSEVSMNTQIPKEKLELLV